MVLQDDAERVKHLLAEAISVLCKNGLTYESELCVEGLLGITLDNSDIFLVNISETVTNEGRKQQQTSATKSRISLSKDKSSTRQSRKRGHGSEPSSPEPSAKRSSRSNRSSELLDIKAEKLSVADDDSSYAGDDAVQDDSLQDEPGQVNVDLSKSKGDATQAFMYGIIVKEEPGYKSTSWPSEREVRSQIEMDFTTTNPIFGLDNKSGNTTLTSPEQSEQSTSSQTIKTNTMAASEKNERSSSSPTVKTNVGSNKASSPGNKHLKCTVCGIVFSNRADLKGHMVEAHRRNEFKCKYCGKSFLTMTGLQSHVPQHNGLWKFTCNLCQKGFQRKLDYEGHMNKHNDIKFICSNCDCSFYHKANWLRHQSRCGK